ncbi:MAG: carboxypeptidase regulatory-like domain-containing protein [Acidobacteria bacterium]|nr:carboxypeptidase regulatory-like domain-containing protein [Acidobacteriota bacterium]
MHSSRARFLVALLAALCLLAYAAACSKGVDDADDAEGSGDDSAEVANLTPYKPNPAQEGSIAGTISYAGAAPEKAPIAMTADPVCAAANPDPHSEDIVVNGDKLQNVLVYIKEGKVGDKNFSGFSFAPGSQPATLDQHGCHYVPHVQAVQVNQTLNITNSDQTSHNINFDAKLNEKFNQGQGPQAAPISKPLKRAEVVVPVKCNQHPWMRAYVAVLPHPFFAITDANGKFEIKNVPAGTYTLVAWHEKDQKGVTQTVTVTAGGAATSDFSFSADQLKAENTQGGALRMMPALEFPMLGMEH